eukprot:GSChrysophyteH2.ASY1.ANO1.130.1 assembled CDS
MYIYVCVMRVCTLTNPLSLSLSHTHTHADSNEPPLLEELGIHFDHIWLKTLSVVYVPIMTLVNNKELDSDLTGPIIYCMLLGCLMLLRGKVNFGYIYGFSVVCSVLLHQILLLLQTPYGGGGDSNDGAISVWETCSILGYSLIPVVLLAAISIVFSLRGYVGSVLSMGTIIWSTFSATRLFDVKMYLQANNQYWLVAYPVAMLYACFTLMTVF